MSTENITRFNDLVGADPTLQTRVAEIYETDESDIAGKLAALSQETDAPFTAEELTATGDSELSLEDLSAVSGGVDDGRVKLVLPRHLIKLTPIKRPPTDD